MSLLFLSCLAKKDGQNLKFLTHTVMDKPLLQEIKVVTV